MFKSLNVILKKWGDVKTLKIEFILILKSYKKGKCKMRKKKFLSLLLTFAMMMCLMPMKISIAEPTTDATLSIVADKSEAHPGDTINYTVKMGPITDLNVFQMKLDIPEGLTFTNITGKNANNLKNAIAEALFTDVSYVSYDNTNRLLSVLNCGSVDAEGEEVPGGKFSSTSDTTIMSFSCTVDENTNGDKTVGFIEQEGTNVRTKLARSSTAGDVFGLTLNGATTTITAAPVAPTGVSLDKHELNVDTQTGDQTLTATISPDGATGTLVWSTNNGSAATVTDNNDNTATVTINGVGTANITVTIEGTDYSDTCTVNVTEYVCPHTNKTETAAKDPTCTEAGNNKYYFCPDCQKYLKADGTTVTTQEAETILALGHNYENVDYSSNDTQHWKVCSRCNEDSAKENHTFDEVNYRWGSDDCTASHTCKVCGKEVSETVGAAPQDIPATCTEAGKTRYTANFTKAGFETQTKEVSNGQPAGHNWGVPTYTWSADNSTCIATRTCARDASHKETETVEAAVTTTATCTKAGTTTYTATFTNEAFNDDSAAIEDGKPGRTKTKTVDALGHDFTWVITQEATEDQLGVEENKCSRCGGVTETRQCAKEKTSPSKYSNGTYISDSDSGGASAAKSVVVDGESKEVKVILQDPLGVYAGQTIAIDIESITTDLGENYDGNISVEKAYKANVILKIDGVETSGQLDGKVRLLLEIPDDPNNPNDDWDDEELQVQRIQIGDDAPYVERIEYQLYDAYGNFIKVVEKDHNPEPGEVVRKFMVVWTDHFSEYAVIDPDIKKDDINTKTEDNENKKANSNLKKTGESLNEVYFAGVLLSAAILVLYLALKKRREV